MQVAVSGLQALEAGVISSNLEQTKKTFLCNRSDSLDDSLTWRACRSDEGSSPETSHLAPPPNSQSLQARRQKSPICSTSRAVMTSNRSQLTTNEWMSRFEVFVLLISALNPALVQASILSLKPNGCRGNSIHISIKILSRWLRVLKKPTFSENSNWQTREYPRDKINYESSGFTNTDSACTLALSLSRALGAIRIDSAQPYRPTLPTQCTGARWHEAGTLSLPSINVPRFHRLQLSLSNDTNEKSSAIIQAMFQHAFQANHLQNGE